MVRALTSYQCNPGSIPRVGVIFGLSLLVLYSAPTGFSTDTPAFLSPQVPTFDLFALIVDFSLQCPQLMLLREVLSLLCGDDGYMLCFHHDVLRSSFDVLCLFYRPFRNCAENWGEFQI